MKSRAAYWLLIINLIIWAFAAISIAKADDCYVDQAGVVSKVAPNLDGKSVGLGSAHGTAIVEKGIKFGMRDQKPISGPETRYGRPPVDAPLARRWWDNRWLTPETYDPKTEMWTSTNCYFLNAGRIVPQDPPGPGTCGNPVAAIPHASPNMSEFNPRIFPCGGTPRPTVPQTRTSTPKPGTPTKTPTKAKTPTPGVVCCPPNIICPKGVPTCVPTAGIPMTPSVTRLPPTPSRTAVSPVPPTHVPVRTAQPPTAPPTRATPITVPPRPTPTREPTKTGLWAFLTGCRSK